MGRLPSTFAAWGFVAVGFALGLPLWPMSAASETAGDAPPDLSLPAAPFDGFGAWLQELKAEAAQRGYKPETVAALDTLAPLPRVVELDRRQPEFTLTYREYVDRIITDEKIAKGRHKYEEHSDLLREIGERYGVQPRFIVALWGIETDFGRVTGAFQVLPALATLAYDSRRSAYFRSELFHALTIIDEGHTTPERMIGSWAGAMGQPQFMPSTFVRFAVDYDGDGRRDIWTTPADVFASAANYLSRSGWRNDHTWGREVRLPEVLEPTLFGLEVVKKLDEWNGLGLRRVNGRPLPKRDLVASLIRPVEGEGPAYLVYDNFRMLMKWNRSIFFALTVGQLADRIGDR